MLIVPIAPLAPMVMANNLSSGLDHRGHRLCDDVHCL